jgi:hypothetical protein
MEGVAIYAWKNILSSVECLGHYLNIFLAHFGVLQEAPAAEERE